MILRDPVQNSRSTLFQISVKATRLTTLSEGMAHATVHHHLKQLSVYLQSDALIFIS